MYSFKLVSFEVASYVPLPPVCALRPRQSLYLSLPVYLASLLPHSSFLSSILSLRSPLLSHRSSVFNCSRPSAPPNSYSQLCCMCVLYSSPLLANICSPRCSLLSVMRFASLINNILCHISSLPWFSLRDPAFSPLVVSPSYIIVPYLLVTCSPTIVSALPFLYVVPYRFSNQF